MTAIVLCPHAPIWARRSGQIVPTWRNVRHRFSWLWGRFTDVAVASWPPPQLGPDYLGFCFIVVEFIIRKG